MDPASRNHRGNPSLLIKHAGKVLMIDAGKTFREQCLRYFPRFDITHVDAVILTHEHADAVLGIDDIRSVQMKNKDSGAKVRIDMYASRQATDQLRGVFPYLFPQAKEVVTFVATLNWNEIDMTAGAVTDVHGLSVISLPVLHGPDFMSLGFAFGESERVVYISDVSVIPDDTMALLKSWKISVLILDCLMKTSTYIAHINLPQGLDVVRLLKPTKTLLIGMSHDFDHDSTNAELKGLLETEGLDVQLAHDGLEVMVDL